MLRKITSKMTYVQIIALGFLILIALGTALLSLPCATRQGLHTGLLDAFFTATSACCVTGLVVFDTYSHFTLFGQIVIILLIQIGGLGLMTVISMFALLVKRKIGVYERMLLKESTGAVTLGGIVKLLKKILLGTLLFEGAGAVVLFGRFSTIMDTWDAVFCAIFHSVSAFCNAGFDIMGRFGEYSSLSPFSSDPVVLLCIAFLIIVGGLGFVVWIDIAKNFRHPGHLSILSKVVLVMSVVLILSSTVLFFIFEYDSAFAELSLPEKLLNAFFQAVSPRTAGYNAVDISKLSESGSILTVMLMFIGAGPASTAGGIKMTTFLLLLASTVTYKNNGSIVLFKRKIPDNDGKTAGAVVTIYLLLVIVSSMLICSFDGLNASDVIFEATSAIGTVGLTKGITSSLSSASRVVIAALMFIGRIGGLSIALAFAKKRGAAVLERPEEKLLIG